jgi:hypothetical protein
MLFSLGVLLVLALAAAPERGPLGTDEVSPVARLAAIALTDDDGERGLFAGTQPLAPDRPSNLLRGTRGRKASPGQAPNGQGQARGRYNTARLRWHGPAMVPLWFVS